jgi:hypothetical protein
MVQASRLEVTMSDDPSAAGNATDLTKAYQRPYQQPCDAHTLLEALSRGALKSAWPFRDDVQSPPDQKAA